MPCHAMLSEVMPAPPQMPKTGQTQKPKNQPRSLFERESRVARNGRRERRRRRWRRSCSPGVGCVGPLVRGHEPPRRARRRQREYGVEVGCPRRAVAEGHERRQKPVCCGLSASSLHVLVVARAEAPSRCLVVAIRVLVQCGPGRFVCKRASRLGRSIVYIRPICWSRFFFDC